VWENVVNICVLFLSFILGELTELFTIVVFWFVTQAPEFENQPTTSHHLRKNLKYRVAKLSFY
jgi:hypothetical protein